MAAKVGSFRHSFLERSKERLLSRKGYSDLDLNGTDGGDNGVQSKCFRWISDRVVSCWSWLQDSAVGLYKMGRSDPRKVIFPAKLGLCLALVSVAIFSKVPVAVASQYSVWAILTIVVVFEFSVGIGFVGFSSFLFRFGPVSED